MHLLAGSGLLPSCVHRGSGWICLLRAHEAVPPGQALRACLINDGQGGLVAMALDTPRALQHSLPGTLPSQSRSGGLFRCPCHMRMWA